MNNNLQINVLTSLACKNRIDIIKKTWGKHFSNIVYYADFEEGTDIVKCTDNPTAYGNEEKIINRIKQIKENNNCNWYFFVDDDTFVNIDNLLKFVETADLNKTYGEIIGGWGISYFQGGAGVLISKQLIDTIPQNALYLRGSTFSDVALGQVMVDSNIEMVNERKFYSGSYQHFNLTPEQIKAAITFHHIADSMVDLYNELYKK
jgi:hypothetical protein